MKNNPNDFDTPIFKKSCKQIPANIYLFKYHFFYKAHNHKKIFLNHISGVQSTEAKQHSQYHP